MGKTLVWYSPEQQAKHLERQRRRNPLLDAHGLPVMRGDALEPTPISQRWEMWKICGFLFAIVPSSAVKRGWKAWRDQQASCDKMTPMNLPG